VARVLATAPLISIGRVSYAWYLWHWPLLAFANILSVGTPSPELRAACVLGSLLLSYPTVAWVEKPVRFGFSRRVGPAKSVIAGLAAGFALILLSGGVYGAARFGLLNSDPMIAAALTDVPKRTSTCLRLEGSTEKVVVPPKCLGQAGHPRIVLWGDSFANQWRPALDQWQDRHHDWRIEQLTVANCPPLLSVRPGAVNERTAPYAECVALNAAVAQRLAQQDSPSTVVILAANWLAREGGDTPTGLPPTPLTFDVSAKDIPASLAALARGLDNSLTMLDHWKLRSIVVLQSPRFVRSPAACVQRLGATVCAMRRDDFDRMASRVNAILRDTVARHPTATVLDPRDILCSATICPVVSDSRIAYSDTVHVAASTAAAPRSVKVWGSLLDRSVTEH